MPKSGSSTHKTRLKMKTMKLPSGKVIRVPEGISMADAVKDSPKDRVMFETIELKEKVLELYLSGYSVRQIAKMDGFPTDKLIYWWMTKDTGFRNKMKGARASRALVFEERAVEVAENVTEDDVGSSRLKVDTYKWVAEVNDPDVYGKKTKVTGDKDNPVVFQINTGFPEPLDHQKDPILGTDGIIQKVIEADSHEVPDEVSKEVFKEADSDG